MFFTFQGFLFFMLLAVDVGNTSIKFGIFEGDSLISKFVVPTKREYTPDDIESVVNGQLGSKVSHARISSVVPELDKALANFLSRSFGTDAVFVQTTDDFGLTFNFPVHDAGTDRLVNSFAAAEIFGTPCIIVAFGTATTIDVVNREREHLGGLIAPGPATISKALQTFTSKLPEVEIVEPSNVINTTTITSIQSGIFYSQLGLVEASVPHIRSEIGEDAKVIATGGFAHLFANKCKSVKIIEPDLTLVGLRMLYSRSLADS